MGLEIGIDPTLVRTAAEGPAFKLGTLGYEAENPALLSTAMGVTGGSGTGEESTKIYMYVTTSEAITGAGYAVIINSSHEALMLTTTEGGAGAGAGNRIGLPMAAIESGGYGWVQVYGHGTVRGAASCVRNTVLYTTATPGVLDDAATAGFVRGLVLTETLTGAAAASCVLNWPYVSTN